MAYGLERNTHVEGDVVGGAIVRKHVKDGATVQPHPKFMSVSVPISRRRKLTDSCQSARSWSAQPFDMPVLLCVSPSTHY